MDASPAWFAQSSSTNNGHNGEIHAVKKTVAVRKRDGLTVQPFDASKITTAISKAWRECGQRFDEEQLQAVTELVASSLQIETVDVEQIQDAVEVALMKYKQFAVAKAYILYRQKRAEARQAQKAPDPTAVSDYIHFDKYAKFREDLGRREVYLETVARVEEMHLQKFAGVPGLAEDIRWAFDRVREKRVLPSMRSMQFGGEAVLQKHNRIYNCSFTAIDRPRAFAESLFLLLCGCGVGFSVQYDHIDKLPALKDINSKNVVHFTIPDTVEGWADALHALINSHIRGYYIEFNYSLIRPEGSPLKTSGGKAPGHLQLKRALEAIRVVLQNAAGRKLRPIECYDIMCHAADAVLSGGIRRSAMICLFSLEDAEMMYAKTGAWDKTAPWRANTNNSVMLKRDEVQKKQFKRMFQMTREWGDPGFYFTADYSYGTNPCQPSWATVLTPEGIRTFADIDVGSTIWSGKRWTKVTAKVATGVKPVYNYRTRAGNFNGTEQHRVVSEGRKIEVDQAETIDVATGGAEGGPFDVQAIMDGLVLGDGTIHKPAYNGVALCIGKDYSDYQESEIQDLLFLELDKKGLFEVQTTIRPSEVKRTFNRRIPDRFRFGSEKVVRSFLRGLFSANGSVNQKDISLKAASFAVIVTAQEMLSSIGIGSSYTINEERITEFSNGQYKCKQSYNLRVLGDRLAFRRLIGFIQDYKQRRLNTACALIDSYLTDTHRKRSYEILEKTYVKDEPVFDITVDDPEHVYWTGGLLVSNCVEIGMDSNLVVNADTRPLIAKRLGQEATDRLEDGQTFSGVAFCNLCEQNAAKFMSFDDFVVAAKAATIIGTLQASYTDMPYLGWVSEVIAERDALLGIGMTGMLDAPEIATNPEYQRIVAERVKWWNAQWAQRIGIRPAARTSCVKPSGTTSLELGCVASGHHAHHARRYIRRVTAKENQPVFQRFRAVNPLACVRKGNGDWIVEFPVQAPDGALIKDDLGAIEFLEMVKSTQLNWVLPGIARTSTSPGLSHNVSNTVTVKANEWDLVAEYLWENREYFTGVALLSATGDKDFAFAPMEAVTTEADEARWNQLVSSYQPVDYTTVVENEELPDFVSEPACAGGKCSV